MIPKMKAQRRGRKPARDPKQTIPLFVEQSIVKKLGGKDKMRTLIYNFLHQNQNP